MVFRDASFLFMRIGVPVLGPGVQIFVRAVLNEAGCGSPVHAVSA